MGFKKWCKLAAFETIEKRKPKFSPLSKYHTINLGPATVILPQIYIECRPAFHIPFDVCHWIHLITHQYLWHFIKDIRIHILLQVYPSYFFQLMNQGFVGYEQYFSAYSYNVITTRVTVKPDVIIR